MKKTLTVETKDNKIIITYFDGSCSELIPSFKMIGPNDEVKLINRLFNDIVNGINMAVRKGAFEAGISIEEKKMGKHFFKLRGD